MGTAAKDKDRFPAASRNTASSSRRGVGWQRCFIKRTGFTGFQIVRYEKLKTAGKVVRPRERELEKKK